MLIEFLTSAPLRDTNFSESSLKRASQSFQSQKCSHINQRCSHASYFVNQRNTCYYKNSNIIQVVNMIIYYVFWVLLNVSIFLLTLDGLSRVSGLLYASSIILLVVIGGFILYCCLGILAEIQEFFSENSPKSPENVDTKINEDGP